MQCLLLGSDSLLIRCAEQLAAKGWNVRAIVTDVDRVSTWATTAGILTVPVEALEQITQSEPFDWLFSITHLSVVPSHILERARLGAVNFHDGPLPKYGGLNAPLWALLDGQREYAISWHRMNGELDAGEVLIQHPVSIEADETALTLNAKCWEAAVASFPLLLDLLAAAPPTSSDSSGQPLDQSTFHRLADRPSQAGRLDPQMTVDQWLGLMRAADTGHYANAFVLPWFIAGEVAFAARRATPIAFNPESLPGTILEITPDSLSVQVADGAVRLEKCSILDGRQCNVASLMETAGATVGSLVPAPTMGAIGRWDDALRPVHRAEPRWLSELLACEPVELPWLSAMSTGRTEGHVLSVLVDLTDIAPESAAGPVAALDWIALAALFVGRLSHTSEMCVGISTVRLQEAAHHSAPLIADQVPWRASWSADATTAEAIAQLTHQLRELEERAPFLNTMWSRYRDLEQRREKLTVPTLALAIEEAPTRQRGMLAATVSPDARRLIWSADPQLVSQDVLTSVVGRFKRFAQAALENLTSQVQQVPLIPDRELQRLATLGTGAVLPQSEQSTVVQALIHQAQATPERTAVVDAVGSLRYRELLQRSAVLAKQLRRLGVRRDDRVALACLRSNDMVVAMLAIMRAGGAYVPLDPQYPLDRLQFMLHDSGARILLTQRDLVGSLVQQAAHVVYLEDTDTLADTDEVQLPDVVPDDLAYVIYTSGSTGRPKGVMVEHRNVVNFFNGMDNTLGGGAGTWLAVTSMSFDISVLELCWTLARGYTVIIAPDTRLSVGTTRAAPAAPGFSLYYFSADEEEHATNKYRLLTEGARFADQNGFEAVWTPERHFHAFGGLYPNPSVTSAAVAMITSKVAIRAGSCVLPIHHPARVAEEWAMVDNLSNGRVGISFAAGWQPNDFVFRPENYGHAKDAMFRDIDVVRRLWRGETVTLPGPRGDVAVRTLPRPLQPELPFWVTTAGNPETFSQAGAVGANLLTHLLGQTVEELAPKIAAYRAARKTAGHEGPGKVTLMLHTFLGESLDEVREAVRAPMTAYLRTSVNLIKQYAGAFPTLRARPGSDGSDLDFASLSEEEMDALLAFSFERYFSTSALFGTVESTTQMVQRLRQIGVDEVACLIDFGLPTETVLTHLPKLNDLRRAVAGGGNVDSASPIALDAPTAIAELMTRHRVTHFQCTPSMARLLLHSPAAKVALGGVQIMCVGGEALPSPLAADLASILPGRLLNMYGPTETTIWSTVHDVVSGEEPVPLGSPIVNTTLEVVHPETGSLLPLGMVGELRIGGAGVVRGYLNRPDLTNERFITVSDRGRQYRTGDLVQWTESGHLHFLGRIDQQVKVRGYRIELGEIETELSHEPELDEVTVVARTEEPGDPRLVAFFTLREGALVTGRQLRQRLLQTLPDFMVPAHYVRLAAMPRTPNLKTDRKALATMPIGIESFALSDAVRLTPRATVSVAAPAVARAGASSVHSVADITTTIEEEWIKILRLPQVAHDDNFFDLGGHSLLVVQLHQRLSRLLPFVFPVTDLFRFPTIRTLAEHLVTRGGASSDVPSGATTSVSGVAFSASKGAEEGATSSSVGGSDEITQRTELRRAAAQRRLRPRT